jgi:Prolyl oligopeptidase family
MTTGLNRTHFLGATAALGAGGLGLARAGAQTQAPTPAATTPRNAAAFLKDPSMNFVLLGVLGSAYYRAADVGAVLTMIGDIEDGNPASAYTVLDTNGTRLRGIADAALAAGHRVSAREAYLQASSYTFAATYFCDGMGAPERLVPTWKRSRDAFDKAMVLLDRPVEQVTIPYENTTLPGYFLKVDATDRPRPLLILNNGSDGSVLDMWVSSGAAGLERGYNCLIFDGPGQGAALWLQHLYFRPDWEKVITPVVDFVLQRRDVDPKRIALQGISQGGYWVPRAVAFEHRIAAAIADPGVYDVSTSWTAHMPPAAIALLDSGQKATFDQGMGGANAAQRAELAFRARPYGIASTFDLLLAVRKYTLAGVADKIQCPTLVIEPQFESFWPGQGRQVFDALRCPKTFVEFTQAEGAEYHCEPLAPWYRAQRIFNWLQTTPAAAGAAP